MPTVLVARGERWQPVEGRFDEESGVLWFVPRFPLTPGLRYSLLVDGCEAASVQVPPAEGRGATGVVSIHPTAGEVPLNLLRLYICFSAPMSEGWAARAVRVRRADTGEELENVLLPMEPELWDQSRQRLTLLLEPGRIKRGLGPNAEAGNPLTAGVPVSVVVERCFRDATGSPLRTAAERRYRVGPAIRARVDPSRWRLGVPRAGTRDPFTAEFDRPLDHALLRRCLIVADSDVAAVAGDVTVDQGETRWTFTPVSPWRAGDYGLRVDSRLEDIAGNSVRRVFDRDLHRAEDNPLPVAEVELPLHIT